jgi:hypothetical protein
MNSYKEQLIAAIDLELITLKPVIKSVSSLIPQVDINKAK